MASAPFLRRTFSSVLGFRRQVMGPSAADRARRNETVARIAYGLAYCDGQVHPLEREALAQVVAEVYPWVDQTEILRLFDALSRSPIPTVLSTEQVARIPERLFAEDFSHVPRLMARIAEAHQGVVPAEQALMDKIVATLRRAGANVAPQ